MLTKRVANCFGVASLVLSLSFWVGFLPQSVPGVRLINWGVGTHIILWGVAFLLALVPVVKVSRRWIVALLVPVLNFIFFITIIGLGERMASRPG
jgi:hypothetical protein